jgi:hypothetical protein
MTVSVNAQVAGGVGGAGVPFDFVSDMAVTAGTATLSEQILKQAVIPAGQFMLARYFSVKLLLSKSGTTDAVTQIRLRLGATGTVADALLGNSTAFLATTRGYTMEFVGTASSATNVRLVTATNFNNFNSVATTSAPPVNFTVSDMSANSLILSVTVQMAGTTDTPSANSFILTLY